MNEELSSGKNIFIKKDDTEAKVVSQGVQDKPMSSIENKSAEVQNSFF